MKQITDNRGFTLIEVIAVLIILGILAAVVVSRGGSTTEANVLSAAEALKGHIRFAQFRAMNMQSETCGSSFGIRITANSYFMFRDCDVTDRVILPGADSNTVSIPDIGFTAADITFDHWGRPCTDLNGTTPATVNISVIVNPGDKSETVTITRETGFIE